jgi:hypothetical protein
MRGRINAKNVNYPLAGYIGMSLTKIFQWMDSWQDVAILRTPQRLRLKGQITGYLLRLKVCDCANFTFSRGWALIALWRSTTALLFVGFLGLLLTQVGGPLLVILDNASLHKAKETSGLLEILKENGHVLYFLPPLQPRTESHRTVLAQDEI